MPHRNASPDALIFLLCFFCKVRSGDPILQIDFSTENLKFFGGLCLFCQKAFSLWRHIHLRGGIFETQKNFLHACSAGGAARCPTETHLRTLCFCISVSFAKLGQETQYCKLIFQQKTWKFLWTLFIFSKSLISMTLHTSTRR